jgi:hypothetical protein
MTTIDIIIPNSVLLVTVIASAGAIAIILVARFVWKSLLP